MARFNEGEHKYCKSYKLHCPHSILKFNNIDPIFAAIEIPHNYFQWLVLRIICEIQDCVSGSLPNTTFIFFPHQGGNVARWYSACLEYIYFKLLALKKKVFSFCGIYMKPWVSHQVVHSSRSWVDFGRKLMSKKAM
jgi:hypothetical protein